MFVDQFAEGGAEGKFIIARFLHVAAEAEDLGAGALVCSEGAKPIRALLDDERYIGQRFHIVDHGGLTIKTKGGRKGRAQTRLAQLALQRFEHGGFFATNISTRTQVSVNAQGIIAAKEFVAQQTH